MLFDYLHGESLDVASEHEDYNDYPLLAKTMRETALAAEVIKAQRFHAELRSNSYQFVERLRIFVPDLTAASFRYRGGDVYTDQLLLVSFGNSRLMESPFVDVRCLTGTCNALGLMMPFKEIV